MEEDIRRQMRHDQAMKMSLQDQIAACGTDWIKEQMRHDQAMKMSLQDQIAAGGTDWIKEQMRQDQAMKMSPQDQIAACGTDWAKEQMRQDLDLKRNQDQLHVEIVVPERSKSEINIRSFLDWAGDERVTLAIVFTDVVGSTSLGEELKDEAMNDIRRAHFSQSRKLIKKFNGWEIKTLGDGFMAAFRSADAALNYAMALQKDTGHLQIKIRAGIHVGPMQVEEDDVFGGTVNFAARVGGAFKGEEICLSDRAKEDIDRLGAAEHWQLKWKRHDGMAMKGFQGTFTLWLMQKH